MDSHIIIPITHPLILRLNQSYDRKITNLHKISEPSDLLRTCEPLRYLLNVQQILRSIGVIGLVPQTLLDIERVK